VLLLVLPSDIAGLDRGDSSIQTEGEYQAVSVKPKVSLVVDQLGRLQITQWESSKQAILNTGIVLDVTQSVLKYRFVRDTASTEVAERWVLIIPFGIDLYELRECRQDLDSTSLRG
jgi:hypothetical protein